MAVSITITNRVGLPRNLTAEEVDGNFDSIVTAVEDIDQRLTSVESTTVSDFRTDGGTVEQPATFANTVSVPTSDEPAHAVNNERLIAVVASNGVRNVEVVVVDETNSTPATAYVTGQVVNGRTLLAGDRILRAYQDSPLNGVYVAGSSPVRASDVDAWTEVVGLRVLLTGGEWAAIANPGGTLGSTNLRFVRVSTSAVPLTGSATVTGAKDFTGATLTVADPGANANNAQAVPASRLLTALASKLTVFSGSTPSGGVDGDVAVTLAAPYALQGWKKTAGTWAIYAQTATFETLPDPTSCPFAEYLVTTIDGLVVNQVAHSDGTRWRPNDGRWRIAYGPRAAFTTNTTTATALRTITLPVGLTAIGDEIRAKFEGTKNTTSAGTITCRVRMRDGTSTDNNVAAFTQAVDRGFVRLEPHLTRQSGTTHSTASQGDNDDGFANSSVGDSVEINFANPVDVEFEVQKSSGTDSFTMISAWVEVHVPYLNA